MIRAQYDPRTDGVVFYARNGPPSTVLVEPVVVHEEPHFSSDRGTLSSLMDDLWNMGVRPTASRYHSDQVEAMRSHLDDLRDITRHVLKMEPKP